MGGLETTVQPQEAAAAVGAPTAPGTPSAMPTVNRTAAARNDRGAGMRSPPISDFGTILSPSESRSPWFGPSASGAQYNLALGRRAEGEGGAMSGHAKLRKGTAVAVCAFVFVA